MITRSVVSLVLLFLVGGLLFQRRSHTQSCRHAAAGIPNVSHGNVRNENKESYGTWRNENLNKVLFPLRLEALFTILHSQNCRKTNARNVPGDGVLLIRLLLATCTTPTKHDEVTRVQTLVSWPADGATFPWPAVCQKPTVAFTPLSKTPCCISCCNQCPSPRMQILPEMLNETVVP